MKLTGLKSWHGHRMIRKLRRRKEYQGYARTVGSGGHGGILAGILASSRFEVRLVYSGLNQFVVRL